MIHSPGVILLHDYLCFYNISVEELAKRTDISEYTINQILNDEIKITPIISIKLGLYFNQKYSYWSELQLAYDFYYIDFLKDELKEIIIPFEYPLKDFEKK